jgi:hypothetical protein
MSVQHGLSGGQFSMDGARRYKNKKYCTKSRERRLTARASCHFSYKKWHGSNFRLFLAERDYRASSEENKSTLQPQLVHRIISPNCVTNYTQDLSLLVLYRTIRSGSRRAQFSLKEEEQGFHTARCFEPTPVLVVLAVLAPCADY